MKKVLLLILVGIVSAAVVSCGGGEQVKQPEVKSSGMWVDASNKQLEKVPFEGFGYKSSAVPGQKFDKWAKAAAPVIKGIIEKLPPDHVLQVTGHTDARGPEQPEGNKPGNIKISSDRAKAVHGSLTRQGIKSDKMTFKGVGSSQLKSGVDPESDAQRRVTFKVVPK